MSTADSKLDAQLRDVCVPDGLLDRLMRVPLTDDEGVDELVNDVTIPPGLIERLRAIPLADDDGLDEALRSVPIPDDLFSSFHTHFRRHHLRRGKQNTVDRMVRISRIIMAASLILGVTLSLGGAMLLSMFLNGSGAGVPGPQLADRKPAAPTLPAEKPLETSLGTIADVRDAGGQPPRRSDFRREISFAPVEASTDLSTGEKLASTWLPREAALLESPMGQAAEFLGSHNWDDLPELPTRPVNLDPHGLDWPVVRGSNGQFLVLTGFHPFVSPSAHARLQSCQVPLAVEPSSYELARRYLERNEWPPADRVRTEEILAAVDYNFPKPTNQSLGLSVAGGPSPIKGEGFCLLQVGVQARETDVAQHAPIHLVLLIDTSTSMRWGSRMEIVRRALSELPRRLGPDDRLSLVTFNQAAHVWAENMGRDSSQQLSAVADSLAAEGATNIVAGLREAYGVGRPTLGPGRPTVRVVLLTDGLLDLEPDVAEKIERQVAEAAGQNIPLDVIDLGQQKGTDSQVTALAQAGRGTVHRAVSAQQIGWAFREIVTGRSQVVARSARLQVTFNPKSVLEYRLVGHESGDWGSLLPGPLEADFHEGQTATALFEVRLDPNGPNDLASVDLAWYGPDSEKTLAGKIAQTAHVMVERRHFAASLGSSAPSLQAATVVAYAAEVMRHSPFVFPRHHDLSMPAAWFRAVELSGQVESQLRQVPSFAEFAALLRQELKAHPAKRTTKD